MSANLDNITINDPGVAKNLSNDGSKKQSLKKWEEELWSKVADYCDNDVLATADFLARESTQTIF